MGNPGLFYFLILGLLSTRNKNIKKEERDSKRKRKGLVEIKKGVLLQKRNRVRCKQLASRSVQVLFWKSVQGKTEVRGST